MGIPPIDPSTLVPLPEKLDYDYSFEPFFAYDIKFKSIYLKPITGVVFEQQKRQLTGSCLIIFWCFTQLILTLNFLAASFL